MRHIYLQDEFIKFDKYQINLGKDLLTYDFISEGFKGLISKCIKFTLLNRYQVFNMALGDKDIVTGEINTSIITSNGDSRKVLATVIAAVYDFCNLMPYTRIYFYGNTNGRARLYKILATKYYEEVNGDFDIYGQIGADWEPFEKGRDYIAFLVQRKP